jgi:hypothetical protein
MISQMNTGTRASRKKLRMFGTVSTRELTIRVSVMSHDSIVMVVRATARETPRPAYNDRP